MAGLKEVQSPRATGPFGDLRGLGDVHPDRAVVDASARAGSFTRVGQTDGSDRLEGRPARLHRARAGDVIAVGDHAAGKEPDGMAWSQRDVR